jgi:hypothetical protein
MNAQGVVEWYKYQSLDISGGLQNCDGGYGCHGPWLCGLFFSDGKSLLSSCLTHMVFGLLAWEQPFPRTIFTPIGSEVHKEFL